MAIVFSFVPDCVFVAVSVTESAREVSSLLVDKGGCMDTGRGRRVTARPRKRLVVGHRRPSVKLRSSRPFWPVRDGLPSVHPPLEENTRTDVAIIGGGVTGAILADELTDAGNRVVVLDRRDVAT